MSSFDKSLRRKRKKRKTKATAMKVTMMTKKTRTGTRSERSWIQQIIGLQFCAKRSTFEVSSSVRDWLMVGGDEIGRSSTARGRVIGECPSSVQTQGAAGRYHQGSQASLLLPEAGREEARQASFGAKACPKKESQRVGLGCNLGPLLIERPSVSPDEVFRKCCRARCGPSRYNDRV
jgi:hypothetical protein